MLSVVLLADPENAILTPFMISLRSPFGIPEHSLAKPLLKQ
jgi:hypothetical protein